MRKANAARVGVVLSTVHGGRERRRLTLTLDWPHKVGKSLHKDVILDGRGREAGAHVVVGTGEPFLKDLPEIGSIIPSPEKRAQENVHSGAARKSDRWVLA